MLLDLLLLSTGAGLLPLVASHAAVSQASAIFLLDSVAYL